MRPTTPPDRPRVVVLGVGEPLRQDDGLGPRVVGLARDRLGPDVEVVERVIDPLDLLDRWSGARLAVVVDAMRSGAPVGTVRRLEGDEVERAVVEPATSTHGLSLRDAVALGRALGKLPERLVVILVEAGEVALGEALTPTVHAAVDRAVVTVAAEVARRPMGDAIEEDRLDA